MLKVPPQGDPRSAIWIVGEAPGAEEEIAGIPFVGPSGQELDRILRDAGIDRATCYVTNACQHRPPDNKIEKWVKRKKSVKSETGFVYDVHPYVSSGIETLRADIQRYRPRLVIGFGNCALWALSGEWGINAWRGSEMVIEGGIHFVPTLHPAAVLRSWDLRAIVVHDLKYRCVRRLNEGFTNPQYKFNTNPLYDEVMNYLEDAPEFVALDIESSRGKTVCLGVAKDAHSAICIPFWNYSGRYWSQEDERDILHAVHAKRLVCGQNWNYDRQYLQKDFGLDFKAAFDTYIAQSVLFPGSERKLGYLSSMYCDWHLYWKEDNKDWNNIKDFPKLFRYNCMDTARTWEVMNSQIHMLREAGLMDQFDDRMNYANGSLYKMMQRGVCRDPRRTKRMIREVQVAIGRRKQAIEKIAGKPVNFDSNPQVANLLFKQMGFKPTKKTEKGAASTDDEALRKLVEKSPEAEAVCTPILEARSLTDLKSTFLEGELDPDGRLRSSWMATGTETFRLTSSKNAFHRGAPLQNITDGQHTHSGRKLPNLRSTIVPPPGCTYWNCDLARADLQVVAWEAEDESLKNILKEDLDIHLTNAIELFDIKGLPYDECKESHPNYVEHKEKHKQKRHFAKTFCHLTDYGGQARTCAVKTHTTIKEAERCQKRWFELHPGILKWHQWVKACLYSNRTVRNKFGFRRVYFDRIDSCFTEALAWIPQSTVSIVISRVQMAIDAAMEDVAECDFGIELQVHDSLSGFFNPALSHYVLPRMWAASRRVIVPYDDPLIIPLELELSDSSWGEVQKVEWPVE